ncbi:MAG: hypothetical protein WCF30_01745 [Terracidiphilus sp.]
MVAVVIEVTLIAVGILPLVVTTPRPSRAVNRDYCGRLGNARRSQ